MSKFFARTLFALVAWFGMLGLVQAATLVYQGQICWQDVSRYDQVVVHFQPIGNSDWDTNMLVNNVTIGSTGHGSGYAGQSGYLPGNSISLGWLKVGGCSSWVCASYNASINYGLCNPTFEDTGLDPREGYFWFEGYKYINPTLSVSKSANPYNLVAGASGQYYTISIGVSNGPTTAAISIYDSLPAGFTTSGPITASGGSLSGCPPAGSSNLSGCTIASNTYGPITIYVPVAISSAASSYATNYAYIYGGGDPNCNSGCVAGTTNPVTPANPTLNITKALNGNRLNNNDQFTVQILSGTQVVSSATTSGSGNLVNAGTTGVTPLTAGTSYNINEIASGSTTLAQYQGTVGNCSGTGASKIPSALGSPFTLANGDAITCTLTNTVAVPTISVTKSLGGNRAVSTDQFTVQLLQSNVPLSLPGNGTTSGLNAAVDSGTGTTGRVTLTAGGTYTVNEVGVNSTNLARYNKALACSNSGTNFPLALGGSFTAQNGDNIVCTLQNDPIPPTISLSKALGGNRYASGDQFTVQILRNGSVVNSTLNSTTQGSGSGVNTGSGTTGTFTATANTSYTLNEVGANGANLAKYSQSLSCQVNGGAPQSMNLGASITPIAGDNYVCTLTNTPLAPVMRVIKALNGNRADDTDQFTVQILRNGSTVVNSITRSSTTGSGSTVDPNTGITGDTTLEAGTSYTINEIAKGSTNLARYTSTLGCVINAGTTNPLGLDTPFTPQLGDDVTCTITNQAIAPVLEVRKLLGGTRVRDTDQFTVRMQQSGSTVASSTTSGTGSAIDLGSGDTGSIAITPKVSYSLSESISGAGASALQYGTTLGCQNTGVGGTNVAGVNLANPTVTLAAGDYVLCKFINTPLAPTLALHKELLSSRVSDSDQFTVQINAGTTVASATTDGSGSGVTAGATGAYTATAGTTYTLTEVPSGTTRLAQYTKSMTCTNSVTVQQGGTDVSGITTLGATITPRAGDVIDCAIRNQQAPTTLALTQLISTGSGVPPGVSFDYSGNNGWGSRSLTSNSEGGTGVTGPSIALTANSTETVLTATLLPGWEIRSASCTDANGSVDGNGPGSFGSPLGNTLHIPAANVVAGAALQCTVTLGLASPTIVVNKLLGANRISNNDQFTVQLKTGTTVAFNGSATAGLGSSVNTGTGTTGTLTATAGTVYNLGEAMASSSDSTLGQYGATVGCSNAHLPAGSGSNLDSVQLLGDTFSLKAGDVVTCNITNTALAPTLTVTKALGSTGRIHSDDQFTVQIVRQSDSAVVNTTSNSTSGGSGTAVTGGTTGVTTLVAGTSYSIKELAVGPTKLSLYDATVDTCSNSLSGGTVLPAAPGTPFSLKAGDAITCKLTNTPKLPSITLDQFVAGGIALPATYQYTGTNGWTTKSATSTQGGTPGTPTPVQNLTAAGVSTDLTPTLPPGLRITFAYCADPNYLNSGNTGGTFGSFTDTTFTIPADNIKAGSTLVCHVQIGFTQPKLTLLKTTTVGTGSFTFNGVAPNANGFGTNYGVSTSAAGTPASGSAVTLTATNTLTQVQETVPAGWVLMSASCTDKNYGVTNNTDTFGTLINGTTLQIPAAKVGSGVDLQCLFTNAPTPTITLNQFVAGGVPVPATYNYTGTNGWTAKDVTSTQAGVWGVPTPVQSLTAAATDTVLTPALTPGLKISNAYCTDSNYLNNGNTGGTFGSFTDSSFTIPAINLKGGSVLVCHVEISFAKARLTIQKTTTVGTGSFTFNGVAPNANGFSTNSSYSIGTSVAGTPVKGGTVTLSANNALTQIQETLPSTWTLASASCIDLNASLTHNTDIFGSLINTTTLEIPVAKVSPGSDLLCTFTNAPTQPTLKVTQRLLVVVPYVFKGPVTFNYSGTNGWTTKPITANQAGASYSTAAQPLGAINTSTTVQIAQPSANWAVVSFQCADSNRLVSGNPSGSIASSSTTAVTIAATYIRPSAVITCTILMSYTEP